MALSTLCIFAISISREQDLLIDDQFTQLIRLQSAIIKNATDSPLRAHARSQQSRVDDGVLFQCTAKQQ
jgi:hypothetical protein